MKHTTIKNYSGSQSAINAFKLYSFLFQIIKSPEMYLIAIGKSRFEGIFRKLWDPCGIFYRRVFHLESRSPKKSKVQKSFANQNVMVGHLEQVTDIFLISFFDPPNHSTTDVSPHHHNGRQHDNQKIFANCIQTKVQFWEKIFISQEAEDGCFVSLGEKIMRHPGLIPRVRVIKNLLLPPSSHMCNFLWQPLALSMYEAAQQPPHHLNQWWVRYFYIL